MRVREPGDSTNSHRHCPDEAVATSFVKHLADPAPLKAPNIQVGAVRRKGSETSVAGLASLEAALLGLDANPLIWTRPGASAGVSSPIPVECSRGMVSTCSEFRLTSPSEAPRSGSVALNGRVTLRLRWSCCTQSTCQGSTPQAADRRKARHAQDLGSGSGRS